MKKGNTNPSACVLKVRMRNPDEFTSEDEELLKGWKEWSLEDIILRLNSAKWSACLGASGPFGEIVFLKLLEAANNPNIPFELIERVAYTILHTGMDYTGMNIFESTGFQYGDQVICDFFLKNLLNTERTTLVIII